MYEKFNTLLKKRNISAYKVAKDTGITQSTFSEWKKGTYTPKLDKLNKIASYFDIPVEYFTESESISPVPDSNKQHLTKKDLVDLNKYLNNTEIMFDGELHQLDDDDREKLRHVLEFVFWQAKEKNKRKPTK